MRRSRLSSIASTGHFRRTRRQSRHVLTTAPQAAPWRKEDGFGLIELMIAMTVLNIGILAIVAAFNSGALALRRASMISSSSAVADGQMETYRALRNCAIYLDHTQVAAAPTSYTGDSAYNPTQVLDNNRASLAYPLNGAVNGNPAGVACPVTPPTTASNPHQQITGPDNRSYWVDTYIVTTTPTNAEPVKQVTIVVRDPNDSTNQRFLVRESSTFDFNAAPDSP
jgi:Tfp pilus assembly protein PilE